MNLDALNKWLTLAANIGVLIGIFFLADEIRLNRSVAEVEAFYAGREGNQNVRSMVAEHADIWNRGCLDLTTLSDTEKIVFLSIVSAVNYRSLTSWNRGDRILSAYGTVRSPLGIALSMHRFPGFREAWLELEGFGKTQETNRYLTGEPGPWQRAVYEQYQNLMQNEPQAEADTWLCGR